MYSSTFIFATKQFDDDFHRLDQQIAAAAKAIPGYLGEETWENTAAGLVSNVYYWESLEALQQLVQRVDRPWEQWLTHAATAVVASAATLASAAYLWTR